MEWIKAKYDRLLLGLFGVIALLVGGMLVTKVLGFKSHNFKPRQDPPERTDFGTTDALKTLDAAKTRLTEPAEVKPPAFEGVPISLLASAPVVKTADGKIVAVRNPNSEPIRPPIANEWLYNNELDITRSNIAEIDSDGDFFTNTEEFNASPKTNPRDKGDHPAFWAKLSYVQCIKDPLTLKFTVYLGPTEITIRRSEPADKAFNVVGLKQGDSFPAEKGSTEMRFKIVKVDASIPEKEKVYLDDLSTGKVENLEIEVRKSIELPTLKAKIICSLGKEEEQIAAKGGTIEFAVNPEYKFTVENITEEEVVMSFTEPGGTEKKTQTFKLSSPP